MAGRWLNARRLLRPAARSGAGLGAGRTPGGNLAASAQVDLVATGSGERVAALCPSAGPRLESGSSASLTRRNLRRPRAQGPGVAGDGAVLESYSYDQVLKRGFRPGADGATARQSWRRRRSTTGQALHLQFHDGVIDAMPAARQNAKHRRRFEARFTALILRVMAVVRCCRRRRPLPRSSRSTASPKA